MPVREKILDAATQLYAETGFHGATTRQIAQRAGVNEVTLFRHFGSKTALLHEAIQCACGRREQQHRLPDSPRQVREELLEWASSTWQALWQRRAIIRTAMGELGAHPELYPREESAAACAGRDLTGYLERLQSAGLAHPNLDVPVAAAGLLGMLFADALTRDIFPAVYRRDPERSIEHYVDLFIHAIAQELR